MKVLSEARQPEVTFCIFGQWFYPMFGQVFFITERTLSSTILVAFRHARYISSVRVQPLYSQRLRQKSGRLKVDFH